MLFLLAQCAPSGSRCYDSTLGWSCERAGSMVIRWAASNQPRGEHKGGVESQVAKRPVYAYAHAKDLQPRRKGGAAISMEAAGAGKNSPRRRLKASSLTALSPMPLKNSAVRVSARYAEHTEELTVPGRGQTRKQSRAHRHVGGRSPRSHHATFRGGVPVRPR